MIKVVVSRGSPRYPSTDGHDAATAFGEQVCLTLAPIAVRIEGFLVGPLESGG